LTLRHLFTMAPFGKIWTYPNNFRAQRVHAVAALNGLLIETPADFKIGVTNRTPEFLAKFPLGKVPAFELADGSFCLTEAQAIAFFVAESGPKAGQLVGEPGDTQTRGLIGQWACFAEHELANNVTLPLLMTVSKMRPFDPERYAFHEAGLLRALKRLNVALDAAARRGSSYLVGDRLSLADVMVLGPLQLATKFLLDAEMRAEVPAVEPYLRGLLEVPELKEAFGELVLCETRVKG